MVAAFHDMAAEEFKKAQSSARCAQATRRTVLRVTDVGMPCGDGPLAAPFRRSAPGLLHRYMAVHA